MRQFGSDNADVESQATILGYSFASYVHMGHRKRRFHGTTGSALAEWDKRGGKAHRDTERRKKNKMKITGDGQSCVCVLPCRFGSLANSKYGARGAVHVRVSVKGKSLRSDGSLSAAASLLLLPLPLYLCWLMKQSQRTTSSSLSTCPLRPPKPPTLPQSNGRPKH